MRGFPAALVALAIGAITLMAAVPATAQYYDQDRIARLLDKQHENLENLPEVTYEYWVLNHPTNNSIFARHDLYLAMGDGDVERGREFLPFLEFLTRQRVDRMAIGDTIVLPNPLGLDNRAYAPFPRYYSASADLGKIVVIHKQVQAWAAYEDGRLVRWGLANTGRPGLETPGGRYNINWRTPERISSESPPGQVWLMRWVLNFYNERGFHMHQYAMPTGGPASAGCVRLFMADARWLYDWVDPWVTSAGRGAMGGNIIQQGTMVLVLGEDEEPTGPAPRFRHTPDGPEKIVVALPEDPFSVPAGSAQQRFFDRQHAAQTSR
jgi:hypothetical protein